MSRLISLIACSLLAACVAQNPEGNSVRADWEEAAPSDVGMDSALLARATEDISAGIWGNVHALLVVRSGKLVHEAYFPGQDELWFEGYRHIEFGPGVRHGVRSVSKSFTATLVGIAIDQGLIESVDVPLRELLPQYADLLIDDKTDLTLREILTMTAGLRWAEGGKALDDADDDQYDLQEATDPVELVLARPLETPPGTEFNYSGGLTQVLAAAVEHAAGTPLLDFAEGALFRPLRVQDWEWFSLGNARPAAWVGLRLTGRDLAKLGQVYLDGGRWQGGRIVSAEWVESALSPEVEVAEPGAPDHVTRSAYGFQWWYDLHKWEGGLVAFHSAMGNGGQRIIVVPQFDVVVAILAGFYEDPENSWTPEALVREYVLAAVLERE